jgi:bifunctional polynucleotide phosphatase/kinase
VVHGSLLIGRHKGSEPGPPAKRRKIAAFDFVWAPAAHRGSYWRRKDSTLIQTSSGNVFGKDATDWKWWDPSVPAKLKSLRADGYVTEKTMLTLIWQRNRFDIVIISNQAGLSLSPDPRIAKAEQKKVSMFKEKVGHVLNQLDLPICILAATARDQYRKPRVGMWNELIEELDYDEGSGPDIESSIFIGDAAGRLASKSKKADHSSSDRYGIPGGTWQLMLTDAGTLLPTSA